MIVQHILGKILQMKKDHFFLTERMWFVKPFGRQNWIALSLGMDSVHIAGGRTRAEVSVVPTPTWACAAQTVWMQD